MASTHHLSEPQKLTLHIREGDRKVRSVTISADQIIIATDADGRLHVELVGDELSPTALLRRLPQMQPAA